MSSADSQERYLPTGWRIVGPGAGRIAEQAAAYAARLEPGEIVDTLYAVQCTMQPDVRGRQTVECVLDAVTEEIRAGWPECPRLLRDEVVERPATRYGGLHFDFLSEPGREWVGEVVWRAVHPVVAGAAVTTRVLIEERPTYTRLNVRVTADQGVGSVRGFVGAGQAQPQFLSALRQQVALSWLGGPLATHDIADGAVEDFVATVLGSVTRSTAVAVLAPTEDGEFVVDPHDFAHQLLGRAQLYVIPQHRLTFRLSDAVGDRGMAAYWGAVRAYMPGWTRHDDPREHPLLVADRLTDPVMRATWLGELGVFTGRRLILPPSVAERRLAAEAGDRAASTTRPATTTTSAAKPQETEPDAAPRAASPAPAAQRQESDVNATGAPAAALVDLAVLTSLLENVSEELRGMSAMVRQQNDEIERLRTIASVRSSSTTAIERRLGRLEDLLQQAFPSGAETDADRAARAGASQDEHDDIDETGDEGRTTLVDVVRDAAETHGEALVFLDAAFTAAAASPYEDPERVRAILDAMARIASRRRDGDLGMSLRDAFTDVGIDYRGAIARGTSARLREQYRFPYRDGHIEAEEHIVLGNTYDPRRCLRIYFTSRLNTDPRFIIAHIGRHFEVKTST